MKPKDFRERVVNPLIQATTSLVDAAQAMGGILRKEAEQGSESDYAALIKKNFKKLVAVHQKKLSQVAKYHAILYKYGGKRVERACVDGGVKTRAPAMFRSVGSFKPELYAFIKEASGTHESLKPAARCLSFKDGHPLKGYMSPVYASQFILAYAATNCRFSAKNGQYIQPDDLMTKHLSAGIAHVLERFNEKNPDKAKEHPGEFTFCHLQKLIGFYRMRHAENSAEAAKVKNLRENETYRNDLRDEFLAMSEVRASAFKRYHDEHPKPVVTNDAKKSARASTRGPLDENTKLARKLKRAATVAARASSYEFTLTKKVSATAVPAAA